MPAETRIYRVDDGQTTLLVRAPNAAQAVRHAAKKFSARVATQEDLCELIEQGLKVQQAANGGADEAGGDES